MPVRLLTAVAVGCLVIATVVKTANLAQRAFLSWPLSLATDVGQLPDAHILTPTFDPAARHTLARASEHIGRRKAPDPAVAFDELRVNVALISLPPPRGA